MKVVFPSGLYKRLLYNVVWEEDGDLRGKRRKRAKEKQTEVRKGVRKKWEERRDKGEKLEARLGPLGTPGSKRFLLSLVLV